MTFPARRMTHAVAATLIAVLALTGCTASGGADSPETTTNDAGGESIVDVVVGELSGYDGAIDVGEEISVLVNLPADEWTVTNGNPAVVDVSEEETSDDSSIVRLTGIAAGESTVVFEGASDERDEITVVVSEP